MQSTNTVDHRFIRKTKMYADDRKWSRILNDLIKLYCFHALLGYLVYNRSVEEKAFIIQKYCIQHSVKIVKGLEQFDWSTCTIILWPNSLMSYVSHRILLALCHYCLQADTLWVSLHSIKEVRTANMLKQPERHFIGIKFLPNP